MGKAPARRKAGGAEERRQSARATGLAATHTPRVFVVAEVKVYAEALAATLALRDGLSVIGAATASGDLVERLLEAQPDIVIAGPEVLRCTDLGRDLRAKAPSIRVLAIGIPEVADDVIACAEAGAAGYVAEDADLRHLVQRILAIGHGELPLTPTLAASVFRRLADGNGGTRQIRDPGQMLTIREYGVLRHLERGLANKEIAKELGIEVATVKNHVHSILRKLHVRCRAAAIAATRATAVPGARAPIDPGRRI